MAATMLTPGRARRGANRLLNRDAGSFRSRAADRNRQRLGSGGDVRGYGHVHLVEADVTGRQAAIKHLG